MIISPGILAQSAEEFREKIFDPELRSIQGLRWHIDVLDGSMFHATNWADAKTVGSWGNLPDIELHLMTENPVAHLMQWHRHVPSVRRAIVHAEIRHPLSKVLTQISAMQIDRTVALNPATSVDALSPLLPLIDEALIMGVEPGASGKSFLGEPILAKIRRAQALYPDLHLAVDGGVTLDTLPGIGKAGALRCVSTSALWSSHDKKHAHADLEHAGSVVL